jgi:hypothetical protein
MELNEGLNLTPFYEAEAAYYSDTLDNSDDVRFSNVIGATLQTRLHKAYKGKWGFSGFKHITLPSITYSYRPEPNLDVEDTPRFDAYDSAYGRSRLESKWENIVLGQDEESGETWQMARVALYYGTDFWNELRKSDDYEVEIDFRPVRFWGLQLIGESHNIRGDTNIDSPFYWERRMLELSDRVFDTEANPDTIYRYNAQYGDYDRVLAMLYYDNTLFEGDWNARLGFSYARTDAETFNREVLYGLGYRINDKWSVSFEHRYDLEEDDLARQEYEIRRVLNCVEAALRASERSSGWDLSFELSVTALPGTRLRF